MCAVPLCCTGRLTKLKSYETISFLMTAKLAKIQEVGKIF